MSSLNDATAPTAEVTLFPLRVPSGPGQACERAEIVAVRILSKKFVQKWRSGRESAGRGRKLFEELEVEARAAVMRFEGIRDVALPCLFTDVFGQSSGSGLVREGKRERRRKKGKGRQLTQCPSGVD
eukprot:scaffold47_cov258-Pinguiococcus_pyrenoidosus.AAC.125